MQLRIFIAALLLSVPLSAQTAAPAFDKSMLITNDDEGKTEKVDGILRIESDRIVFDGKKDGKVFEAAYADVTKLIYERTKKPRYSAGLLLAWPLLFTKEKQHYLTVESKGAYAFIKLHKGRYRAAIAALESASGKEVERLEE